MQSHLRSAFLVTALASSLLAAPDPAAQLLHRHGSIPIAQAGPHVAPGTFRIQVAAKLGQPDFTLPDGTWLYRGRRVKDSDARGTLVVRFAAGRVSSLAIATDAVVAHLRADPSRRAANEHLAKR